MMFPILSALALGLPTVSSPAEAPLADAETITVVGEKLKRTGGALRRNPLTGKMTCRVTVPSGNARVDAAVCNIALACAKEDHRDRDRLRACIAAGKDDFLDRYHAEIGDRQEGEG